MVSIPFKRLCHWGPISALAIIKLVTWAMVHLLGMWWPPHASLGGTLNAALFLILAFATLYYFLQSLLEGPGFVPLGWRPENESDVEYLQFCTICNGYKAPRSHHCKKCGRCVMKMDHHCPWINCCVGHMNHWYFTIFLLFAVLGCFYASVELTICVYHAINRVWYIRHGVREPMVYLTLNTLLLSLLAIGMAVGVVLAVGTLLYFQVRSIMRNRTTIEDWIVTKAEWRRQECGLETFVFPYDLGARRNLALVVQSSGLNGLRWPVKEGCSEHDLTLEQIHQKAGKRRRAVPVVAARAYGGGWLPLVSYPRACLHPPCSDEPRLPLAPGQHVLVSRHRRHWLFGELVPEAGDGKRAPRGWFPRAAVEAVPKED